jgi:selenide,water dikinase
VGPGDLEDVLKGLGITRNRRLLVGRNTLDDAAVYRLAADQAMVSTVDLFTPVVDDPASYGRIAAANAMSDIYAMGGRPLVALNVLCFSPEAVPKHVVRQILKGGQEKVLEAGAVVGGGHSMDDKELKFGLCVTGIVRPDEVVRNSGALPGDLLILTKPLGIGLMTTGIKFDLLSRAGIRKVTSVMEDLNATASRVMLRHGATACTDITGFGFLGHAGELAGASGVDLEVRMSAVPVMTEAYEMLRAEAIAGGLWANRSFVEPMLDRAGIPDEDINVLCDPQTSGGLLMSVPEARSGQALASLRRAGVSGAAIVGKVLARGDGRIIVRK